MGVNKCDITSGGQTKVFPIKAGQASHHGEYISKSQHKQLGNDLVPLVRSPCKTKLHSCHQDPEGLSQSHAASLAVGPEPASFHKLRKLSLWVFLLSIQNIPKHPGMEYKTGLFIRG